MRRIRHYGKSTVPAGLPAMVENMTLMMPVSGSAAAQLIIRHGLDLTAQRLRQLIVTFAHRIIMSVLIVQRSRP